MWIDSHCHLNHTNTEKTADDLVNEAKEAGVDGILTICCRISEEMDELRSITAAHDNVWCSVGTHPHDASKDAEKAISADEIVKIAQSDDKIIGIGESGLDYYYNYATPEDQQSSFRKHIQACIAADLPLIVHARDADDDIIRIIREEGQGTNLTGVMHCFSSSRQLAEDALDFGFYISFSGIVTFKKSTELQDIAKDVPLDRILVETDAPFLAPTPYRGKTNEPAYVVHTGSFLAELLNLDQETIANHSKQNFFTLFDKAKLV